MFFIWRSALHIGVTFFEDFWDLPCLGPCLFLGQTCLFNQMHSVKNYKNFFGNPKLITILFVLEAAKQNSHFWNIPPQITYRIHSYLSSSYMSQKGPEVGKAMLDFVEDLSIFHQFVLSKSLCSSLVLQCFASHFLTILGRSHILLFVFDLFLRFWAKLRGKVMTLLSSLSLVLFLQAASYVWKVFLIIFSNLEQLNNFNFWSVFFIHSSGNLISRKLLRLGFFWHLSFIFEGQS